MESIGSDSIMAITKRNKKKREFGDFQTPVELTKKVCALLVKRGLKPASILEPTCGTGSFLVSAREHFKNAQKVIGLEVNGDYVRTARDALSKTNGVGDVSVLHDDFFNVDWKRILESLADPLLVIGNPPWITNAELGSLGSSNLPKKVNSQNHRGIEAITGKSNFDISEWMLTRALEWIDGREATLAMLCKTSVARKVLFHGWKSGKSLKRSDIYHIDATKYFGAAVEACLLVIVASPTTRNFDCLVHNVLKDSPHTTAYGYREGCLVASVTAFERWKHLMGEELYRWRSGIKHDCSNIMELREENGRYRNGLGEITELDSDYIFPMLKSSEIAKKSDIQPSRWMLVTQRSIGEDTNTIEKRSPNTWEYLNKNASFLDRRSSSVYQKRPRFSVFGVGDYSFAPWKVAISGFYKELSFRAIGPYRGKPVVFDDTCYFVPCQTREEALFIAQLFNSDVAKEFFSSFIFWDEKRPIKVDILRRLDLLALAKELKLEDTLKEYTGPTQQRLSLAIT